MSKFEHPYIEHPEFLEFVVPDTARDEEFFGDLLDAMVEATKQTGKRRVLIDRGAADPNKPVEPMVIYRMALRMADAFGASVRIAAFSRSTPQLSFWEDVSSNRGAIVKAGCDRESLIEWLLQDS